MWWRPSFLWFGTRKPWYEGSSRDVTFTGTIAKRICDRHFAVMRFPVPANDTDHCNW